MQTHYDRLKVAPDAPAEVIRAAYRALSQRHHPDRNPGDAEAERRMQALNEAYAVLSDPARRGAYDATLVAARPAAAGRHSPSPASLRPSPVAATPGPRTRAATDRRQIALVLGIATVVLAGGGLAWHIDRPAPASAGPTAAAFDEPQWTIRGLDPAERPADRPRAPRAPVRTVPPPWPAAPAAPAATGAAAVVSRASVPASGLVVADPNGRAWPFEAGYVAGLPQRHGDGRAAVTVDNRGGASAVFVKLVALDTEPALAVRHVYLPAMARFTIGQVRPGLYELHYQDLFTGRTSRSPTFELRRAPGATGARYSELDIAIHPVPGGVLLPDASMAPAF